MEIVIVAAFLFGIAKRFSYGTARHFNTFILQTGYLAPYDGPNILFFAAWPMLAVCLALYLLRDRDVLFTVSK
ncbi:MAG: hypothetical protein U5J62_06115 [Desulfurivibrio sp.]|nr:hypothetical protein [Desulfurivibrio sp.]